MSPTMTRILLALVFTLAAHAPAFATWSVVAVDAKTGQAIIASATGVRQQGFPPRQPNPSRDLMDAPAVIAPGVGVAACQAGGDHRCNCGVSVLDFVPCDNKTAHVADIVIAEQDDVMGATHNDGQYSVKGGQ